MRANKCKLCGLSLPSPAIMRGDDAFCCIGCREVYARFGAVAAEKPDDAAVAAAAMPDLEGAETFLRIDGMHCSSCELLIERLARNIDGVITATASYATSTVRILYDRDRINEAELGRRLSRFGYTVRSRADHDNPDTYRLSLLRVIAVSALTGVIMMLYLAFYYPTHLGLVGIEALEPIRFVAFVALPRVLLILTTILIAYGAAPIFRGAWVGVRTGALNMDNLLAVAILAAYGYSVIEVAAGSLNIYFDVAATIVAVVTIGRFFEGNARQEATAELAKLVQAVAPQARVRCGDKFVLKDIDDIHPGERITVWPGEPVPIDGRIVRGAGAIDEHLMTGEPFPVRRATGDTVVGGAMLVEGEIEIESEDQIESQIDVLARALWKVQSSMAGVYGLGDSVARLFVPAVLLIAVAITAWTARHTGSVDAAMLSGLAALIVSCPCTFGLAIPLTSAVTLNTALKQGIVFTSADVFDRLAGIDVVVLDKTGTLSTGEMTVSQTFGDAYALELAAAVERRCAHPIARAIARLNDERHAADLLVHPGRGAEATVDGKRVVVGSKTLLATLGWTIPEPVARFAAAIGPGQGVVSYIAWDGEARAAIVTSDQPRPGWQDVLARLRQRVRVVLLTGAEYPGEYGAHVDEVYAGVPPPAKAALVARLSAQGSVVMIGDGSNDAAALAAADLGIAFGAPSALAADAADVIITGQRLEQIFDSFDLIATTRARVRQNLVWALVYNLAAISLAVSGHLNPLFAAIAMGSSSALVVWNSMRPLTAAEAPGLGAGDSLQDEHATQRARPERS